MLLCPIRGAGIVPVDEEAGYSFEILDLFSQDFYHTFSLQVNLRGFVVRGMIGMYREIDLASLSDPSGEAKKMQGCQHP